MLAAIAEGESRIEGFLEGEDTRATAAHPAAAGRAHRGAATGRCASCTASGCTACAAATRRSTAATPAPACACWPGCWPASASTASWSAMRRFRRRPMARVIDPLAAHGRAHRRPGRAGCRHFESTSVMVCKPLILRTAGSQRAGEVGGAAGGPVRAGRDARARAATDPRLHRAHAGRLRLADRSSRPAAPRLTGGHGLRAGDVDVPADFSSAAFFLVAATLVPGSDLLLERRRHQSAPHRPAGRPARDGRRHRERRAGASRAASRSPTCACVMRRCAASSCPKRWCRT